MLRSYAKITFYYSLTNIFLAVHIFIMYNILKLRHFMLMQFRLYCYICSAILSYLKII